MTAEMDTRSQYRYQWYGMGHSIFYPHTPYGRPYSYTLVCIRGVQNFVGFFEKIFRQALCPWLPSIGGVRIKTGMSHMTYTVTLPSISPAAITSLFGWKLKSNTWLFKLISPGTSSVPFIKKTSR